MKLIQGSIIFQLKEPIGPDDDAGEVYERLMKKGAELVLKTVRAIEQNNYPSIPQPEANEIKHAPKIFKETCEIKWNQSSDQVKNFVCGLVHIRAHGRRLRVKYSKFSRC